VVGGSRGLCRIPGDSGLWWVGQLPVWPSMSVNSFW
jgi:hypothetical protein